MAEKKDEQAVVETKPYSDMTVLELEQESYRLEDQRVALRATMIEVQDWLGKRNEEARISQLLGRPVQVISVPTVEVSEGEVGAASTLPAEQTTGSFSTGE
jgi:hypothetical protein